MMSAINVSITSYGDKGKDVMYVDLCRLINHSDNTVGAWYVNGKFISWILEDEYRKDKLYEETRIDDGIFELKLRTDGGMNVKYKAHYDKVKGVGWHLGMLWITGLPRHEWVYLHVGNTDDDTAGCPLAGQQVYVDSDRTKVTYSRRAYEAIYPIVANHISAGKRAFIRIYDLERSLQNEMKGYANVANYGRGL